MSTHQDFDALLAAYREACPEPEASANFMPSLWERIQVRSADEQRRAFWFYFGRMSKPLTTLAAAVCLLLGLLNLTTEQHAVDLSYADTLAATHTAESTNFGEGLHAPAPGEDSH